MTRREIVKMFGVAIATATVTPLEKLVGAQGKTSVILPLKIPYSLSKLRYEKKQLIVDIAVNTDKLQEQIRQLQDAIVRGSFKVEELQRRLDNNTLFEMVKIYE